MNEIREIVTKAVVGKGKKLFRLQETINPPEEPFSILGCWIINHEFEATLTDNKVDLTGTFEINIWYSIENNTRTEIVRKTVEYCQVIKTRQIVKEVNSDCRDVIVRILQQPTCTNATIKENDIVVDVIFEVVAEVIGETKMMVTVFQQPEVCEVFEDDFENEINENFMNIN